MERKLPFSIDEYYHIYNRGTEKRDIYLEPKDYLRFLALLYLCNSNKPVNIREQFPKGFPFGELVKFDRGETLVDIGAYCLMPNHFHLLIRQKEEKGITKFMEKLSTAYSMYFNKRNKRTGILFEGVFKSIHINNDNHLRYLFAYIHLNPVKLIDPFWKEKGISDMIKAKNFLNDYQQSSYIDYLDIKRDESIILNKNVFPEYFQNLKEFDDFINDWLNFPQGELNFPQGE